MKLLEKNRKILNVHFQDIKAGKKSYAGKFLGVNYATFALISENSEWLEIIFHCMSADQLKLFLIVTIEMAVSHMKETLEVQPEISFSIPAVWAVSELLKKFPDPKQYFEGKTLLSHFFICLARDLPSLLDNAIDDMARDLFLFIATQTIPFSSFLNKKQNILLNLIAVFSEAKRDKEKTGNNEIIRKKLDNAIKEQVLLLFLPPYMTVMKQWFKNSDPDFPNEDKTTAKDFIPNWGEENSLHDRICTELKTFMPKKEEKAARRTEKLKPPVEEESSLVTIVKKMEASFPKGFTYRQIHGLMWGYCKGKSDAEKLAGQWNAFFRTASRRIDLCAQASRKETQYLLMFRNVTGENLKNLDPVKKEFNEIKTPGCAGEFSLHPQHVKIS